jgi:putative tricarboxylic transport membrane protein
VNRYSKRECGNLLARLAQESPARVTTYPHILLRYRSAAITIIVLNPSSAVAFAMTTKTIERIADFLWIIFGVSICVEGVREKLWSPAGPDSGFFPFLTGLIIAAVGCVMFLGKRLKEGNGAVEDKFWDNQVTRNRVFFLFISLCAMSYLLPLIGFLLTSILATSVMIRVIEKKSWGIIISISLASCLIIYSTFQFLMQIRLPKGLMPF